MSLFSLHGILACVPAYPRACVDIQPLGGYTCTLIHMCCVLCTSVGCNCAGQVCHCATTRHHINDHDSSDDHVRSADYPQRRYNQ